jgi:hypothetical protein
MQYGIDTAAVGGLQAMPGFLMVFGYEDPASPLGYGIDVCIRAFALKRSNQWLMEVIVNSSAAHDIAHESRSLCFCYCGWYIQLILWS